MLFRDKNPELRDSLFLRVKGKVGNMCWPHCTCLHDVFLIQIRSEQCKNKCAILSCELNNQQNIIVCTISVTEGEVAGLKLV